MRNKEKILNLVLSAFSQVIIMALGFIIPRIILVHYGSDTNGTIGTITQIFTYMALLEAGISQATKNQLYKYLENKDQNGVSKILSLSGKYFKRITFVYFVLVIVLSSILPIILKSNLSYWTIFFVVFFEGGTGVVSFFFIEKRSVLLMTDGKNYLNSIIVLGDKLACYAIKIVLALYSVNIAYIQAGYFLVSLIKVAVYFVYVKKEYPWLKYNLDTGEMKLPDRKYYIITEVAWTVFSSTDMIVLSIFASTTLSSVYSIYSLIFTSLYGLLNAVYQSLHYILGQTFVADPKRYVKIHDKFNCVFFGSITCLMYVSYILILPFIGLYTKGVTDINYIEPDLPIMFCFVQLLSWSRYVSGNLMGVAGYIQKTEKVSLLEMFLNVSLSIVLVFFYGIRGVLFATVIALPFKTVYVNWFADKKILNRKPWNTILIFGINVAFFASSILVQKNLIISINSYWEFIIYGLVIFSIIGLATFILNLIIFKALYHKGPDSSKI